MNVDGAPYVIEYNVRMGDPETQVVFPRINSDVLDLLVKTAQKDLNNAHYDTISETATTVVMVSGGYPGSYDKGHRIYGLENNEPDTVVFHAGTKNVESDVVTSGGRVLNITGIAPDLASALEKSYKRVNLLCWEDVYFRRDIGQDLLALSLK
jgi:phosphoribosylamine--glycine ligase